MNVETVWHTIKQNEGETFYTITGKPYRYVVYTDFLLVNNLKSRKITKDSMSKALKIENPTPRKIGLEGCWGNSYIYGIITDKRIKGF